eukprot:gene36429-44191_t
MAPKVMAKRLAQPRVSPIDIQGCRLSPHYSRTDDLRQVNGGLQSVDMSNGEVLWTNVLFSVTYNPHLERDVQDVFVKSLKYDSAKDHVIVEDEKRRVYVVNWHNGEIIHLGSRGGAGL